MIFTSLCPCLKNTGKLGAVFQTVSYQFYSKDGKYMGRLLNKGNSKKGKWRNFDSPTASPTLPPPISFAKGPQASKRVAVLNKLFMKHITDIMATGRNSNELTGLGIEITKLKVGTEFNVVNVYWVSHGSHSEEVVSTILRRTAGEIRQELTGLNVIGNVPKIQFVRDRSVGSWMAVEEILKTADFGDDYEPKGFNALKAEFTLDTSQTDKSCEDYEDDVPPMRQNVLGLDREAIMSRLSAPVKPKARQELPSDSFGITPNYVPFDEAVFTDFLRKRLMSQRRMAREGQREPQLIENEYEEEPPCSDEDDDFIEEDEESTR